MSILNIISNLFQLFLFLFAAWVILKLILVAFLMFPVIIWQNRLVQVLN